MIHKYFIAELYCCAVLAAGCAGRMVCREKANMLDYEVTPESGEFLAGEEVKIRVRMANRGSAPIQVPDPAMAASSQPVHSITGPRWPEGVRITNTRVLGEGEEVAGADEKLVAIEPGGAWEGVVVVNSFLSLGAEGEYTLRSQFNFQGVKAQSKDTTFRIRPLRPVSIHLGVGTRPLETAEGEGAFLDAGSVYSFLFQEIRPGIGEAMVDRPIRLAAAGKDATDISVPWRNAPFFNEILRWLVWREGRSLKGLSSAMTAPVSVQLPGEISRLVRPPLKRTGGPVEVLALSKDEGTLHLATVGAELGQPAFGSVAWSSPLPTKAGTITAALGPESSGSERHIAFAAPGVEGFTVYHSRYKEGGRLEAFQQVDFPSGRVLGGSTIALIVDSAGAATVGILSDGGDSRTCAFAEVTFGADGKPAAPKVTPLGQAADTVVNTAVAFPDFQRRVAVVQLRDGRLFKMSDRELVEVSVQGEATTPILLAPGKQATYIVYLDSGRGLYLEPL